MRTLTCLSVEAFVGAWLSALLVWAAPGLAETKLIPPGANTNQGFGRSVALSGDTLVIGSPSDDDNGAGSGSAYVFVREGLVWRVQGKLTPSDAYQIDSWETAS